MAQNKDKITTAHDGLIVDFSQTGEEKSITYIKLNEGNAHIRLDDRKLLFSSGDQQVVLDSFSSDNLASGAYEKTQSMMYSYALKQKVSRRVKAAILWGVVPILGFLAIVNLSPAVTQYQDNMANVPHIPQKVYYPKVPQPSRQAVLPDQLANVLEMGAAKDAFTVKLSTQKETGFYVFSDPTCPHCKSLEGELDKLKDNYNITIFPVSAVGGEAAHSRVNNVLCAPVDERVKRWNDVIDSVPLSDVQCGEQYPDPAFTNNQAFVKAELKYTPTIIGANGLIMPHDMEKTATSISQWVDSQSRK